MTTRAAFAARKAKRISALTVVSKLRAELRASKEALRYADDNYTKYLRHLAEMRTAVSRETARADAAERFVSMWRGLMKAFPEVKDVEQ